MMVDARSCALANYRAREVDLSSSVESRPVVTVRSPFTKLCYFAVLAVGCSSKILFHSEPNGCAIELNSDEYWTCMIRRTILFTHTTSTPLAGDKRPDDLDSGLVVLCAFSLEQIALFVRGRSKRLGHLRVS